MTTPELVVHKLTGYVPVSTEMALECGMITEGQARAQGWTPPPPIPWSVRLRWRWTAFRERAGRRVGSWIAGTELPGWDE